jgi:MFS family permease
MPPATVLSSRLRAVRDLRGLAAMRHRNYRLYWIGQLISLVGTHMQRAAQAWLVLTLTSDPLMLGLLVTAQFGPVLVFGLFGGIVADSLPKRPTIIVTQLIAMGLAFVLTFLTASETAQVWQVLVLAFLLGIIGVIDMPTRQSFVIEMVGRDDVVSAVALNSALVNGAKVIGPAVAGLTIAAFGVPVAFMVNGLSFIAVIAGLLAMRPDELRPIVRAALPRSAGAVVANLAEGLRYVVHTREVLVALTVVGLVSTAGMNLQVLIPPLARDVLSAGPSGFGFLMASAGLGAISSALLLAFRGRPRLRSILIAGTALGVVEVGLAQSHWMPLSLILMFTIGLAGTALSMNANTLIQITVPDHLRGRLMAVYITVFVGTTPIGGLIFGGVAGAFGIAASLVIGGVISAIVSVLAAAVAWRWGLLGPPRSVPMTPAATQIAEPDDILV